VKTDVEGAARGLCGKSKGIACIIGTGSSACFFDGDKITVNREGLGYALGDEGGGAHLGKLLLQNYLMGHMDKNILEKFVKTYGPITREEILDSMYKKVAPNKFLGSFAEFYSNNRGDPMLEKLLRKSIGEFVEQSLVGLSEDKNTPINFTGSIACVFEDVVKEVLEKWGLKSGKFMKDPMEGIVAHHIEEIS
jgi:N-acetylglucosamine kinase-like BadF-type ATPase